jgi:hypothetical protein
MHINYPIRVPTAIFAPKSRLDGYSDQVSTKGAAIKLQAELDADPRFRKHFFILHVPARSHGSFATVARCIVRHNIA